jgi:hypothetical protein
MHFVEQTRIEQGKGNCFQACLASIFELPITDIPDWNANGEGRWLDQYDIWLAERGLAMAEVYINGNPYRDFPKNYDLLWIGGFKSPRLVRGEHAVVMRNHEVVWDPHPQREMGLGPLLSCIFFVPLKLDRIFKMVEKSQDDGGAD